MKRKVLVFIIGPFCYLFFLYFSVALFGVSGGYVPWASYGQQLVTSRNQAIDQYTNDHHTEVESLLKTQLNEHMADMGFTVEDSHQVAGTTVQSNRRTPIGARVVLERRGKLISDILIYLDSGRVFKLETKNSKGSISLTMIEGRTQSAVKEARDVIAAQLNLPPLPWLTGPTISAIIVVLLVVGYFIASMLLSVVGDRADPDDHSFYIRFIAGFLVATIVFWANTSNTLSLDSFAKVVIITSAVAFLIETFSVYRVNKKRRLFMESWGWKLNRKRIETLYGKEDIVGWNTAAFLKMKPDR